MRSRIALLTIVLFAGVGLAHADDLMWDNYPSDYVGQVLVEPDAVLQDMSKNMSSERNTQVVYSTWVIDDVDMEQVPGANLDVAELTRLTWVGARETSITYSRADVILLTRDASRETFTTVYEFSDLEYTFTDFDSSLSPYSQAYEGEIVFEDAIPISELGRTLLHRRPSGGRWLSRRPEPYRDQFDWRNGSRSHRRLHARRGLRCRYVLPRCRHLVRRPVVDREFRVCIPHLRCDSGTGYRGVPAGWRSRAAAASLRT